MNIVVVLSVVLCLSVTAANHHGGEHGGHHYVDYYAHPHYEFEYSVHDPHTGDFKAQREFRKGDVVKGFYTLKEADGTTREVHYTADKHNGFNAIVKRFGHAVHPDHHSQYTETSYH
ncbi:hypothetical protein GE061_012540 [Apolygus lucorum]|uniref:Uncharacterized protein n=1 Tax=Apolygus lucorum TaxID=248454 RepID=A0A6A4JX87_APOLU|nr:hypothetical protein GE061_012540 [Apolygus lucorum]